MSIILFLSLNVAYAQDIIKIVSGKSIDDKRNEYPHKILFAALNTTKDLYGDYKVEYTKAVTRKRALILLKEGEFINVHSAPTQRIWEEDSIVIPIPIRKGILSYRLFLVKEKDLDKFSKISSVDEVKKFKAGLGTQWSITKLMNKLNFPIVTGMDYEGLFKMLSLGRFDYFPRGINEIFNEFEARHELYPQMRVENTKALYLPIPTYFFVSPKNKQLAQRIEIGLKRILKSGRFDELFLQFHGQSIKRANLAKRDIFKVDNPLLSDVTPFQIKEYWYTP